MSKVPPSLFQQSMEFPECHTTMLKLRFTIGPDHLYQNNSMIIDFKEKMLKDKCCSWRTSKNLKAADM